MTPLDGQDVVIHLAVNDYMMLNLRCMLSHFEHIAYIRLIIRMARFCPALLIVNVGQILTPSEEAGTTSLLNTEVLTIQGASIGSVPTQIFRSWMRSSHREAACKGTHQSLWGSEVGRVTGGQGV